jgi:ariadne-1
MKWNKEKVLDRYFDNPDELRQNAGIDPKPEGSSGKSQPRIKRIRGFVCTICYDEDEQSKETIALSCDHRFCKDCYTSYLTNKIK